jgi:hypothetical protein
VLFKKKVIKGFLVVLEGSKGYKRLQKDSRVFLRVPEEQTRIHYISQGYDRRVRKDNKLEDQQ